MLLSLTSEMPLASFPTSPATDYFREGRVNESWCEGKSVRNFFCATFHDDAAAAAADDDDDDDNPLKKVAPTPPFPTPSPTLIFSGVDPPPPPLIYQAGKENAAPNIYSFK